MIPNQEAQIQEIHDKITLLAGPEIARITTAWLTRVVLEREDEEQRQNLQEVLDMIEGKTT